MSSAGQDDSWGLGRRLIAWSAVFLCNLLPTLFSGNLRGIGFLAGVAVVWSVSMGLQALPYPNFRKAMVLGAWIFFALHVCVALVLEAATTNSLGTAVYLIRRSDFAEFIATVGYGQLMLFIAFILGYCYRLTLRKPKEEQRHDVA